MINAVSLSMAAIFAAFALLDGIMPARRLTHVSLWRVKGAVAFCLYILVAFNAPYLWDGWLAERTLFDAVVLPVWGQVAAGFVVLQALIYAWHRTLHTVDPLWRHLHQTHHSAERIDIWGAFWFHPLDTAAFALVGSLALVGGVGVSAEAGVIVNLLAAFCAMFQHANLKTPRWIGYIVTRPESHALHHGRGVHRYNYGDVPWFDMAFGTFRNPETAPAEAGFFDGGSKKLWSLLIGRKIA